jgi:hypothetical protein
MIYGHGTSNAPIAPAELINNKMLCLLQFYYSQLPRGDMTLHMSNFYSTEKIVAAKNVLFTAAKGVCANCVQQPVARRGANKRCSYY